MNFSYNYIYLLNLLQVPRQPNSVDCGYYAIHNAHVFMEQSVKSREIIEVRITFPSCKSNDIIWYTAM
jgi:Ulp1 family protease